MTYTILWKDSTDKFEMDGFEDDFIGPLLQYAAMAEGVKVSKNSESHQLGLLEEAGVPVKIIDEDGAKLVW